MESQSEKQVTLPNDYTDGIPEFLRNSQYSPILLQEINALYKKYLSGDHTYKVFFDIVSSPTIYIEHVFAIYTKRMKVLNEDYLYSPHVDQYGLQEYERKRGLEQRFLFDALDRVFYLVEGGQIYQLVLDDQKFGMQVFVFRQVLMQNFEKMVKMDDKKVSLNSKGKKTIVSAKNISAVYFDYSKSRNKWDSKRFIPDVDLKDPPKKKILNSYFGPAYFFPNFKKPNGDELINLVSGDMKIFLFYLKYCVCGQNKEDYEFLLRRLATICHKPGVRSAQAIIVSGYQGTGKSTLAEFICSLYGWPVSSMSTIEKLVGTFNPMIEDKLFISFEEIPKEMDRFIYSNVMDLITRDEFTLHKKHVDQFNAPNYLNVFATTNCIDPDILAKNDLECRRFVAFVSRPITDYLEHDDFKVLFPTIKTADQFWTKLRNYIWTIGGDVKSPINSEILRFLYYCVDVPSNEHIHAGYFKKIKPSMNFDLLHTILYSPEQAHHAAFHFLVISARFGFSTITKHGLEYDTSFYWPGDIDAENITEFPFEDLNSEPKFNPVVPRCYGEIKQKISIAKEKLYNVQIKITELQEKIPDKEELEKDHAYRKLKGERGNHLFEIENTEFQVIEYQKKMFETMVRSFQYFCESANSKKLKIKMDQYPVLLKNAMETIGLKTNGFRIETFPTKPTLAQIVIKTQKNVKNFFVPRNKNIEFFDFQSDVIKVAEEEEIVAQTPMRQEPEQVTESDSESDIEQPTEFRYISPEKRTPPKRKASDSENEVEVPLTKKVKTITPPKVVDVEVVDDDPAPDVIVPYDHVFEESQDQAQEQESLQI